MKILRNTQPKLRAYVFVNTALSPIQKGIQAAHVMVEMALYDGRGIVGSTNEMFWEWANYHKTLILCNGGFHADMRDWYDLVQNQTLFDEDYEFPYQFFSEDFDTLNNLLTAVAIILPDYIYDSAALFRKGVISEERLVEMFPSQDCRQLIVGLSKASLAT